MLTTLQFILICSLVIFCSVLSFLAGKSGREVRIITVKQYDVVEEIDNIPPKFSDLYEDERAFVPGVDEYERPKV